MSRTTTQAPQERLAQYTKGSSRPIESKTRYLPKTSQYLWNRCPYKNRVTHAQLRNSAIAENIHLLRHKRSLSIAWSFASDSSSGVNGSSVTWSNIRASQLQFVVVKDADGFPSDGTFPALLISPWV